MTGNFSGLENLEELYLHCCRNLKELHCSIGYLQKLAILDLSSSIPLKRIPWEMIGKLASLQKLILGDADLNMELEPNEVNGRMLCSLKECPLTELVLYGCNISKISGGVVRLAWLKHLSLDNTEFSSHPDSLLQLHGLNNLVLLGCDNIQSIPNLPGNITSITAQSCGSLVHLPCNISELKSLRVLCIEYCHKLGTEDPHILMKVTGLMNLSQLTMKGCSVSQVPSEIGNLVSLKELNLSENTFSSLPDSLSNLLQLVFLNIQFCEQLRWLPLLPSNLTYIYARRCLSLDVRSSASIRIKVSKARRFLIGAVIKAGGALYLL